MLQLVSGNQSSQTLCLICSQNLWPERKTILSSPTNSFEGKLSGPKEEISNQHQGTKNHVDPLVKYTEKNIEKYNEKNIEKYNDKNNEKYNEKDIEKYVEN